MPVLRDMGKWNHENGNRYISARQAYYKNDNAVENVIRYITRTRANETRRNELICYGGAGVDITASPAEIINQFLMVQDFYKINERGGRRLIHEVYSFTDEEFNLLNNDYALINLIAREISAYFFDQGYMVVYAIHCEIDKRVHIHFAVNSINYYNGKKFVSKGEDFKNRIAIFQSIYQNILNYARRTKLCIMQ